jgi:hypothetical protein
MQGVLAPLVVRAVGQHFENVAGTRRYRNGVSSAWTKGPACNLQFIASAAGISNSPMCINVSSIMLLDALPTKTLFDQADYTVF